MGKRALAGAIIWCCLTMIGLGTAAQPAAAQEPDPAAPSGVYTPLGEGFFVSPKLRRLMGSHTSYQFGDPDQRQLNPLSRLEFPLDSWWGGLEVGYAHPRYSWRLELMTNISRDTDGGRMKDSDWEDINRPGVKTTYSESHARLKPSLTLDGCVDYSLRQHLTLPQGLDLRPLIGLRYQRYTFIAYDGVQASRSGPDDAWTTDSVLGGESIWFRQIYLQPYLGLRLSYGLDLPRWLASGRRVELGLQGDWAFVVGDNRDYHLLREGNRITEEHTTGQAWHASLGVRVPLSQAVSLALSGDYLRIRTSGQHDMFFEKDGELQHYSWDYGVEAWSDQFSLTLSLELALAALLP